jgi:hypothetical protein
MGVGIAVSSLNLASRVFGGSQASERVKAFNSPGAAIASPIAFN